LAGSLLKWGIGTEYNKCGIISASGPNFLHEQKHVMMRNSVKWGNAD